MYYRSILVVICSIALVAAQGPAPDKVSFESGDFGYTLVISDPEAEATLNIKSGEAAQDGLIGAKVIVTEVPVNASTPEAVELTSPLYTFEAGTKYVIKASIRSVAPSIVSLLMRSGRGTQQTKADYGVSNVSSVYTLKFKPAETKDYKLAIGVGLTPTTYHIDSITIEARESDASTAKPEASLEPAEAKTPEPAKASAPEEASQSRPVILPPKQKAPLAPSVAAVLPHAEVPAPTPAETPVLALATEDDEIPAPAPAKTAKAPAPGPMKASAAKPTRPPPLRPTTKPSFNERFENKGVYVSLWYANGMDVTYDFSSEKAAKNGSSGLMVASKKRGNKPWDLQVLSSDVELTPGRTYTFSAWAKADYQLTVPVYCMSRPKYQTMFQDKWTITNQWQQFSMKGSLPKNGTYFFSLYMGEVPGVYYFDDFKLSSKTISALDQISAELGLAG